MATVKKFEDLEVWQEARKLCKEVYIISSENKFSKDVSLKNQINSSSGSVMDNIAEGFGRGGRAEFIQFLSISNGSSAEVRSQLYRALDRNYITQETFQLLYNSAEQISKMLSNFIKYLNKSSIKGEKFKDRI